MIHSFSDQVSTRFTDNYCKYKEINKHSTEGGPISIDHSIYSIILFVYENKKIQREHV